MTTDTIIDSIEKRRTVIDECEKKHLADRGAAMEKLKLFPLNYPVDEMEVSRACSIEWVLFLSVLPDLIKRGEWEFVDEKNRCRRRIQRVM